MHVCSAYHDLQVLLGFIGDSPCHHNFPTLLPFLFVKYDRRMLRTIILFLALTASAFAQNSAKDEAQAWELEKAYWDYVKANDLQKYRALWHENFVGWPFVSPAPVRKDHITDWITSNTSKGIELHSHSIEQLAIQITGDIAMDCYRIIAMWADSTGAEAKTDKMRITHTWIRTHGTWQIIGGMSSPVNANGR
jgi:ketosteroid isomerase-like protein